MQQRHDAPEKSNNLAARSLQNRFVSNLHEAYALMRYKIEYIHLVEVCDYLRSTLACTSEVS